MVGSSPAAPSGYNTYIISTIVDKIANTSGANKVTVPI